MTSTMPSGVVRDALFGNGDEIELTAVLMDFRWCAR
jgi:hypothetical protein